MSERVNLIGLDFGTTTSSAVIAEADVVRSAGTGRTEFGELAVRHRSELRFTPMTSADRLDVMLLEAYLDEWLKAGDVDAADVFGGGALLTGLTAQRENARSVVALVSSRLGEALIATADDPRLESWLAYMGSCAALSRALPDRTVLNLDIGGGTTNLAIGTDGEVHDTACLFVGARHVQVVPGTYRITALSRFAQAAFDHLGIDRGPGDELRPAELDAYLDLNIALLESVIAAESNGVPAAVVELLTQSAFRRSCSRMTGSAFNSPETDRTSAERRTAIVDRTGATESRSTPSGGSLTCASSVITFTGGVGELIYANAAGRGWPGTTEFGDLGIDLAQRIAGSPELSRHIEAHRPQSAGRATALGLMRHSTEVSGSTLFLPDPDVLPLEDVPIFGTIDATTEDARIAALLDLIRHSERGGCVQVAVGSHSADAVRVLGERLRAVLAASAFPSNRLLVLLVRENVGKVLGQYVTQWGAQRWNVVAIDEVRDRDARYVRVGRPRSGIVPVSLYGLNDV